ncbi:MAG: M48 family metallopeptidase [Candidatus Abawacabacteria bacterium]|nr:M48 family metallopeptidase [Candidatus Abawacabacteria bacterium]
MEGKLQTHNQEISYTLKKSVRAKRVRITVKHNLAVVVTMPRWASLSKGEEAIHAHSKWILATVEKFKKTITLLPDHERWQEYKEQALLLVKNIITQYQSIYPYQHNQISIKNTAARWGSCSTKKNLNFNYRIIFLPRELAEYVVVHELCHLKEMNHSNKFWQLVAHTFPGHRKLRKQLHEYTY